MACLLDINAFTRPSSTHPPMTRMSSLFRQPVAQVCSQILSGTDAADARGCSGPVDVYDEGFFLFVFFKIFNTSTGANTSAAAAAFPHNINSPDVISPYLKV